MKKPFGHFILSFLEALLKCSVIFIIQILAIYPLIAIGQGQETMRALLDPAPANISWFLFPIALSYSCVLTASFLFFLLDRWNYPADDGVRAFFRIWIPSILALSAGLLWPVTAEWRTHASNLWDFIIGLINASLVLGLLGTVWRQTRPAVSRNMVIFLAVTPFVLLAILQFFLLIVFYCACCLALTVFCILIRDDFRDGNPRFQPWRHAHSTGLCFAALLAVGIAFVSATSVPWRMLIGAPAIAVCGFSFLVALAFLLTAALSRVSPVLVRVGWMLLVIVLLITPLNHEPLRVLPAAPATPARLPPSAHFAEWLRARPEIRRGAGPYPVFFVAAQGGGVRAAFWTSALLAGLEERYPGFTRHVYAISGVSGGSVGGAIFTSMYRDLPARGGKGCAPLAASGLHGLRPCSAYLFQWDLLGPPLSGFLLNDLPFGWHRVRRARDLEQGLEYAWRGSMGSRRFEEPFQELWRGRPYQTPSLILNATSADTGHRIVISNLLARDQLTAEPDVETFLGRPIRLSTAAFLSARFPVISPVATLESRGHGRFRLVDGGYFDNSGVASIVQLLRAISPVLSNGELAGRIQPMVLVLASAPVTGESPPGLLNGSLASALLEPVSVLANTGVAHEATYLEEVRDLVGERWVVTDLRPPGSSPVVALGWQLSAQTRCGMDQAVNAVLNDSNGSAAIGRALGQGTPQPASWTSCPPPSRP